MAAGLLLQIIFYVALVVQSMSAALAAGRRKMDWFGVCVLAGVTALGGGAARDMLLGHYPLVWVRYPYLLGIVCVAALATIPLVRVIHKLHMPFLLLDGLGLVAFSILGCDVALGMGQSPPIVVVAGVITGVVGGVLRDVLCNDIPLIFSSELYATVSIVTCVIYLTGLHLGFPGEMVILFALLVGFSLRVAAIVFKWEMPKFIYDKDLR